MMLSVYPGVFLSCFIDLPLDFGKSVCFCHVSFHSSGCHLPIDSSLDDVLKMIDGAAPDNP